MSDRLPLSNRPIDGDLPDTRWTLIARLHSGDAQHRRRALDELCMQYHYPLYCYIRRWGLDYHNAQDALHEFLAKLLRNDSFGAVDSEKGRLRSFLVTALQKFLKNWRRDQRHLDQELSIESLLIVSEQRYQKERFTHEDSPDRIYERMWARQMLGRALGRLRTFYSDRGNSVIFDALCPVLIAGGSLVGEDSDALASSLGMKPVYLRVALTRMLEEYREAVKTEISQTIRDEDEIREEFNHLARAFRK